MSDRTDAGFLDANRRHWDERAPAHAASSGYATDRFVADATHLSDVVRFDLPRLGDIAGLRGVHLQCHIGTDTISLARLGARMTGVDFSGAAIDEARRLSAACGTAVEFVQSDVYDAVGAVGALGGPAQFDLVFTGIGALCWLPDIRGWAGVVGALLAPGGRLFLREGHPMLWAVDERQTDRIVVDFAYFERTEPLQSEDDATYVRFVQTTNFSWNHGLGEIVTALLDAGLTVTALEEHDSVPWLALPGQMEDIGGGEWRLAERPWRLPCTYTLQAVKARAH